jgi:hypothetical protein
VDTRDSWSRRRVVAKAEHTQDEGNPRFVVTSLNRAQWKARDLYEKIYCARGDMENRIKMLWGRRRDDAVGSSLRSTPIDGAPYAEAPRR